MAAFKFRLEFMISLRRRKEEEAASRLAKRLASIRELEGKIDSLHSDLANIAAELTQKGQQGSLNGPLLMLYSSHQERVRQEIKKSLELLALSQREEAKERLALKKAVTERQIIEKIKDNQKLAWQEDLAKIEQNSIEELASLAKSRRQREGADGKQSDINEQG
jgi:flagellar export protein FliJ